MDAVAPIVHEWTYESMIYDLLEDELTEGRNVYQGHVLNDKDAMFCKLRHLHFAEASNTITGYCDELQQKNGGRGKNQNVKDMDLKSMAKLVRCVFFLISLRLLTPPRLAGHDTSLVSLVSLVSAPFSSHPHLQESSQVPGRAAVAQRARGHRQRA